MKVFVLNPFQTVLLYHRILSLVIILIYTILQLKNFDSTNMFTLLFRVNKYIWSRQQNINNNPKIRKNNLLASQTSVDM